MSITMSIPVPIWREFFMNHNGIQEWFNSRDTNDRYVTEYTTVEFGIVHWWDDNKTPTNIIVHFISDDHKMNFALKYL